MSRTFGAPAGGTTRGGHQGFESLALSLMTPPNAGGGGSWLPGIVVVALGQDGAGARLLSRVTRKASEALGLAEGMSVFAQVKAVALAPGRGELG